MVGGVLGIPDPPPPLTMKEMFVNDIKEVLYNRVDVKNVSKKMSTQTE